MSSEIKQLREFGKFRLDAQKKVLWFEDEPVNLPLKEIELLCALTEKGGEVVTKGELLEKVWADSFVEESNLSRHIYLLRKTFKDFGENEELIQTIPRRGYRFAGQFKESNYGELIIEKHTLTQTLIEEIPSGDTQAQVRLASEPEQIAELSKNHWLRQTLRSRSRLLVIAAVVAAIAVGSVAFLQYNRPNASAGSGIKSIAVLPFKMLDDGKETPHQGLGMADILITRLSNLKEINVRPTSAVMGFENYQEGSVQIGQKLQVDAVLEGTIYRAGDKVRVTTRLVRVSDQSPIWAAQFEKPVQDEFRLQDEIALQVVEALALNLSGDETTALTKRYTQNADAYQLYVRGRYEWNKRNPTGMGEAERLFRNAIDKDPNFALAYVGLADNIIMGENAAHAWTAVNKALDFDPNSAEAYATLGFLYTFHNWDWQAAEASFKKSIELNPGYATAHHWYAILLAVQCRTEEAKAEMRRALEINPLSYNFLADMGQLHYFAREYDKAEEYCRKALEIYPDFHFALVYLFQIYLQTGEYDKAVDEYLEVAKINAYFGLTAKEKEHWVKQIAEQKAIYQQGDLRKFLEPDRSAKVSDPSGFYQRAMGYAFLGEKEKVLDDLERAYQDKAFLLTFVKADPVFDPLRSEPRYQAILRKMNLAD